MSHLLLPDREVGKKSRATARAAVIKAASVAPAQVQLDLVKTLRELSTEYAYTSIICHQQLDAQAAAAYAKCAEEFQEISSSILAGMQIIEHPSDV